MADKKINRGWRNIIPVLFILAVFSLAFFLGKPSITGRSLFDVEYQTFDINENYTENSIYEISLDKNITSLIVSGQIIGDGIVKIYLDDLIVLDSSRFEEKGLGSITGLVIGNETSNDTLIESVEKNITIEKEIPVKEEVAVEENLSVEINDSVEVKENITEVIEENITIEANKTIQENVTIEFNETAENTTIELNETLENISVEVNETLPTEENVTVEINDTVVIEENITENISQQIIDFSNLCIETCTLENYPSNITLRIEVENAELIIDDIKYSEISGKELVDNQSLAVIETNIGKVEIGKKVLWKEKINASKLEYYKLPKQVVEFNSDKNLKVIENNMALSKRAFNNLRKSRRRPEKSPEIHLKDRYDVVEVEYYTEGPSVVEKVISEKKKIITVSSELHYKNVSTYTNITESSRENIRVYWVKNNSRELFRDIEYIDTNDNGLIDKIQWTIPHLSDQTFEIIIEISKAEHLDEDKDFISDIYDEVKAKDDIWSEVIQENEYVRVTFEEELDSEKDITIYARSNNSAKVEVYEKDSDVKIAEFTEIAEKDWHKIYLTDLNSTQETFDLKIINGSVEFDYIVDPWTDYSFDRCMNITIKSSVSSTLNNFPVYINLTKDSEMLDDYSDLRFYNETCGNGGILLAHEIENATSTNAHIWLKLPSLPSSGTKISVYYKNRSGVTSAENASGVWDDDYGGVWHFNEDPTASNCGSDNICDSTQYNNHGTSGAGRSSTDLVTGKIGGAQNFDDAANDIITIGAASSLDPGESTGEITVSVWSYKSAAWGSNDGMLEMGGSARQYWIFPKGDGIMNTDLNNDPTDCTDLDITGVDQSDWVYHVYTLDLDTDRHTAYINGEFHADNGCANPLNPTTSDIVVGRIESYGYWMGNLDELRISTVPRSADWINMSYNIVVNQASYVVFGDEEERPPDTNYPTFYNLNDNNGTLIVSGAGEFNVTVDSTNGTVLLEINGENITATNISGNVYNATYTFTTNGSYDYKWISWGNGTDNNYNESETMTYVVNQNYEPVIAWINNSVSENPTIGTAKTIFIQFNVTDLNGASHLNDSSAQIYMNRTGETTRYNDSCSAQGNLGETETYICAVEMQYYDSDGEWTINVSIQDNLASYTKNLSTTFTYGTLTAISLGQAQVNFTGNVEDSDVGSLINPLQIKNLGNQDIVEINVTAYDLWKASENISADSFYVNSSLGVAGILLTNNTPVIIPSATSSRDTESTENNATLYFYIDIATGLTPGIYNASSPWTINVR